LSCQIIQKGDCFPFASPLNPRWPPRGSPKWLNSTNDTCHTPDNQTICEYP